MLSEIKTDLVIWAKSFFEIFKTTTNIITSSAIVLTVVIMGFLNHKKHS